MLNDTTTLDAETAEAAIFDCVRAFYVQARADDLLGPIFNGAIGDWEAHLRTMDDFWSGALLGTDRYKSAPFPPHLKLDMGQEHFDRWRDLWVEAATSHLPPPLADKAANMGASMSHCWGRAFVSMKAQMQAGASPA